VSVQLQALADEVFDAAVALDLVVPPGIRPAASDRSETRVAMVQTFGAVPSPLAGEGQGGGFSILLVETDEAWMAFERLIRVDAAECGRTDAMIVDLITACRWRAANTAHRFYLALEGDRAVAHVGLFQHRTSAYLHALFTDPEYRGRGAGSFLTVAMDSQARSVGCERVVLQCARESRLPAYFERLGFRAVGERQIWTTRSQ
jgi:N-acetylglutamate synthase-like GNAT family acetyltransferase